MTHEWRTAGVKDHEFRSIQPEWEALKRAEIELRDQSRRAREVADRLFSRPEALANESLRNLETILDGTASAKTRARKEFDLKRLRILGDHNEGLKWLFKGELKIASRLEAEADRIAAQANQLLTDAGLSTDRLFAIDLQEDAGHQTDKSAAPEPTDKTAQQTAIHTEPKPNSRGFNQASVYLDQIAKGRVPFSMTLQQGSDGSEKIIVKIAPLDCERYDLPAEIGLTKKLDISRIKGIHQARQAGRNAEEPRQASTPAATDPPSTMPELVEPVSRKVGAAKAVRPKPAGLDGARESVRNIGAQFDAAMIATATCAKDRPNAADEVSSERAEDRASPISSKEAGGGGAPPINAKNGPSLKREDQALGSVDHQIPPRHTRDPLARAQSEANVGDPGSGAAVDPTPSGPNLRTGKIFDGQSELPIAGSSGDHGEIPRESDKAALRALKARLAALDAPDASGIPAFRTYPRFLPEGRRGKRVWASAQRRKLFPHLAPVRSRRLQELLRRRLRSRSQGLRRTF